jgi:TPR repeat protein
MSGQKLGTWKRDSLLRLGLGLALLWSGSTSAGPVGEGYGAYQLGDYERAYKLWYPPAEAGDVEAQFYLGRMFAEGKMDGTVTPVRAVFWLGRAANAGHTQAQYELGRMYFQGDGVPRDLHAAIAWWEQAARQGHAEALLRLAQLLHTGEGVPMNLDQAALLYEAAAEAGSEAASQGLAQLDADRTRLAQARSAAQRKAEAMLAPARKGNTAARPPAGSERGYLAVDWIMAQPPTRYTIQLMGARDLAPLKVLLKGFSSEGDISVYSFRRGGELWYAAIYGSYESEATARNAAKRLQAEGHPFTPWIRRFGNIQALDPR